MEQKLITIKQLVKAQGSVAQAHLWLIREGVPVSYFTVLRWYNGSHKAGAQTAALLLKVGVVA